MSLGGMDKRKEYRKLSGEERLQADINKPEEVQQRVVFVKESSLGRDAIFEDIEAWIKSPLALEHMMQVMSGNFFSKRHLLFLDRKERDNCSANMISELYHLSNPGFLGDCGVEDIGIHKYLEHIFEQRFDCADPELRLLNRSGITTSYVLCVMLPEALIYRYQLSGLSREEAEAKFLIVKIDIEEKELLIREQNEARERDGSDDISADEDNWVDHSDLSDAEETVVGHEKVPGEDHCFIGGMEIDMEHGAAELSSPLRGKFCEGSERKYTNMVLENRCLVQIKRMSPRIRQLAIKQHKRRSYLNMCLHMLKRERRYFGSLLCPSRLEVVAGLMSESEAYESIYFLDGKIEEMYKILQERRLSMESDHFFCNSFIKRLLTFSVGLCKKKNIIKRLHPRIKTPDRQQSVYAVNDMRKLSESFKLINEERQFFGALLRGEKFVAVTKLLNKAESYSVYIFIVKFMSKIEKIKREMRNSLGAEANPFGDSAIGKITLLSEDLNEKLLQMYLLKLGPQK